jgi:uncharacterized repeat protein (TIGR03803 family)
MKCEEHYRNRVLTSRHIAITVLVCATLLGAVLAAAPSANAQTFTVLYSFQGGVDGALPYAGVVRDSAGNLFGTTAFGGKFDRGTIFKLDPSGTKTVLYNFTGGADGAAPEAELLLDATGNLFGSASAGGKPVCMSPQGLPGCGTVFKLDPTGRLTVLHRFSGGKDGANPFAALTQDAKGNLYGTAYAGSIKSCPSGPGCGTVFKIDSTRRFTLLHRFAGRKDGGNPYSGVVVDKAGNVFGTASSAGVGSAGVIYKVGTNSKDTVLHVFEGSSGAVPLGGLARVPTGNLFGTTSQGGSANKGTVFRQNKTGGTVLYNFTGGADGGFPYSGVILDSVENLYGTTYAGGDLTCFGQLQGCGTVFKVDQNDTETVLHVFPATGADGLFPLGRLVRDRAGNLYGTANAGGAFGCCGTVFKIAPH